MTSIYSILFCILLFTAVHQTLSSSNPAKTDDKKKCDAREMDRCGATIMVFGKRDVYLPKNEQEMVPHCAEEREAEECVKNYARNCLAPFPRQVIGLLVYGASQEINRRCNADGVKEYLRVAPCLRVTIDELHTCMEDMIDVLDAADKVPADERIPLACCLVGKYKQCSLKPLKEKCGPESVAYIDQMIRGYATEVLDLACIGYEHGSEKCRKIELPQRNNTTPRSASILPAFINIFTKF